MNIILIIKIKILIVEVIIANQEKIKDIIKRLFILYKYIIIWFIYNLKKFKFFNEEFMNVYLKI